MEANCSLNSTEHLKTTFDAANDNPRCVVVRLDRIFLSGNAGTAVDLGAFVRSEAATNSSSSGFVDAIDVGETWTFRVLSLNITDDELAMAGTSGLNGAHGSLEYQLIDLNNVVQNSGTFHFFDEPFGGWPNNLQDNSHGGNPIALWGNNWDNANESRSSTANHLDRFRRDGRRSDFGCPCADGGLGAG